MIDIHLHTKISYDSSEQPESYVLKARDIGVKILSFCEHCDYDVYLEEHGPLPDFDEYKREMERLKREFPDVKILKGLELGYLREALPFYREVISREQPDCVVLSVHTLKDRGDCYFPKFFEGLTKKQAYGLYLGAVLESVTSGLDFDVCAHLGYVTRYAPYEDKSLCLDMFGELIDTILREIIARGKCLEVNTSASGSGEATLPTRAIIQRYAELGGEYISFGSDAHSAADFMRGEGEARALLKELGFENACYFEKRERKIYKI